MVLVEMKKKIICIVGLSGSGKTTAAEYIENTHRIKMIQSYTDRRPRYDGENGHTFVSPLEFDLFKKEDMIAFTEFGGYRYCCLKEDLKDVNTYVIDEKGLLYLKENFSDIYQIHAIWINRDEKKGVTPERIKRDKGMFFAKNQGIYDIKVNNNRTIPLLYYGLDHALKKFGVIDYVQDISYYDLEEYKRKRK